MTRTIAQHPAAARHRWLQTPLGSYVIAAEGAAVAGIWRRDQAHAPSPAKLGTEAGTQDALVDEACAQLLGYLMGERDGFDLPLAPRGTPFQLRVWERLREIPLGTTATYGQIARDLDAPRAVQAVGAAVGRNPISIVIPCHRVVSATGALTGYAGGMDTKRALLALEGLTV